MCAFLHIFFSISISVSYSYIFLLVVFSFCLIVGISAVHCLERLGSKITVPIMCHMAQTLNSTQAVKS